MIESLKKAIDVADIIIARHAAGLRIADMDAVLVARTLKRLAEKKVAPELPPGVDRSRP